MKVANNIDLTPDQKRSIANYSRMGIDVEVLGGNTVKITQARLVNGYLLNQKQLHRRAREIFQRAKIIPVVYSLDVSEIDADWINNKMKEFGLHRNDLLKQLPIDKSTLSVVLSGKKDPTKIMRAQFFYYFLSYESNRYLREQLK